MLRYAHGFVESPLIRRSGFTWRHGKCAQTTDDGRAPVNRCECSKPPPRLRRGVALG